MSNLNFKGIDCRQTGSQLVFRASLKDSSGAKVTTGTTNLTLYEIQSDGTLKSYDFNDNSFKSTALTTAALAMTHRTGNNSTANTGVWTAALSTLTGFTVGGMYLAQVNNSGASPTDQEREFQYGSAEGDLLTTAGSTGQAALQTDVQKTLGSAVTLDSNNVLNVSTKYFAGIFQTARDIGAGVLLIAGTGAGQVSLSGGKIAATLATGDIADISAARAAKMDNLDTTVSSRSTYAGGAVASVTGNVGGSVASCTAAVTVGMNNDKSGYSLAAAGLDSITVTAPSTVATTFPGMLVQVWRRLFKKAVLDTGASTLKTFADDGTTVVTTQTATNSGGVQTTGNAS